ncbi:hypothetical protein [Pseudomonas coronafaciens]|uniref:hypothetical protein n=1 Tax=Pseudomonas coronafaciens TaxID=53409 RepID=UPI000A964130|nr:hypothetical protein [Pseudomonas coronafaciens]
MRSFYIRWAMSTWFGLIRMHKYCPEWDAALNRLIDKHWQTVSIEGCTARFGEVEVWIANRYYAFGHEWGSGQHFRPSVHTMRRLDSLISHLEGLQLAKEKEAHRKKMEGY